MALLSDSLSVWELSFRWAGLDPQILRFRLPLAVQDHVRNLIGAILSAELPCHSISLEKKEYEPEEIEFSIYYWIDDIYRCIGGLKFNRKLLRHAEIGRYDLMLWCERRNIPLPEFWFPPGWNLEYDLPEGDIHPGRYFIRRDWTVEDWDTWRKEQAEAKDSLTDGDGGSNVSEAQGDNSPRPREVNRSGVEQKVEAAVEKLRPNQEAAIACRQIARVLWKEDSTRTIASMIQDEIIQKYGGAAPFADDTVREWIKVVAPPHIRNHRGRPKKGGEGE